MSRGNKKKVWSGIGILLFIIAAIWCAIGFYMKDLPFIGLLFLGSIICVFVGTKIKLDD